MNDANETHTLMAMFQWKLMFCMMKYKYFKCMDNRFFIVTVITASGILPIEHFNGFNATWPPAIQFSKHLHWIE